MSRIIPGPARPATPAPPRNPAPLPRPVPPQPQPRPRLLADVWFRLAVAVIAVGVIGLTTHYWLAYLLLAALPTKQWRAAA